MSVPLDRSAGSRLSAPRVTFDHGHPEHTGLARDQIVARAIVVEMTGHLVHHAGIRTLGGRPHRGGTCRDLVTAQIRNRRGAILAVTQVAIPTRR